jgi:hypothetical protein
MPCVGLAGYSFEMGDGHCSQPPTCPNPPATCDWEAMLFGREKDDCGGAFTYHVNGQLVFSQDDSIVVNTRGHLNCGQSILLELKYGGAPFVALTFICDSCSL